jgi:hypothetical protein
MYLIYILKLCPGSAPVRPPCCSRGALMYYYSLFKPHMNNRWTNSAIDLQATMSCSSLRGSTHPLYCVWSSTWTGDNKETGLNQTTITLVTLSLQCPCYSAITNVISNVRTCESMYFMCSNTTGQPVTIESSLRYEMESSWESPSDKSPLCHRFHVVRKCYYKF